MTPINIDRIVALAEKATPGEWFPGREMRDDFDCPFYSVGTEDLSERENKPHHYEDAICDVYGTNHDGQSNAAFIASCSPETILALCNAVKAAMDVAQKANDGLWIDLKPLHSALMPFGRE